MFLDLMDEISSELQIYLYALLKLELANERAEEHRE